MDKESDQNNAAGRDVFQRCLKDIQESLITLIPFLVGFLAIELLYRKDFLELYKWITNYGLVFLLSFFLYAILGLLIHAIIQELFFSSAIIFSLFFLLTVISGFKEKYLGLVLMPWDLTLNREAFSVSDYVNPADLIFPLAVFSIFIMMMLAFRRKFRPLRWAAGTRVLAVIYCTFILVSLLALPGSVTMNALLLKANSSYFPWRQNLDCRRNGFFLGFVGNIKYMMIAQPSGYSKEEVLNIIKESSPSSEGSVSTKMKPNVIVVMNESFWDPALLKKVTFNKDPLPTFRQLARNSASGFITVHVYGGYTANTEFEVLTGLSTEFLPASSAPYQQYMKGPVHSLVREFSRQGYRTVAIHPFSRWFWGRDKAYAQMGFDRFLSIEEFKGAVKMGSYIADSEVSKKIIREVEKKEEPVFIFAVTMENHGPYGRKKYENNSFTVDGRIDKISKKALATYAQGVEDADSSLRMLYEYFKNDRRPTVIAFFGDHLPNLGQNFEIYHAAGFIGRQTRGFSLDSIKGSRDFIKMSEVPFLIWKNFDSKPEKVNMNAAFLGYYLLKAAGHTDNAGIFRYLGKLYQEDKNVVISATLNSGLGGKERQLLSDYWMLEYDILFGKHYLEASEAEMNKAR